MWQVLVVVLVTLAVVLRWRQKRLLRNCSLQEINSTALPFVGHALLFSNDSEARMKTFATIDGDAMENGGLVAFWFVHKLGIKIVDASVAEFILKNCLNKGGPQNAARLITGNGSLFTDVHLWRNRRKLVAPLFAPKNLSLFVEVFAQQSETLARRLRTVAGHGPTPLWSYFTKYAFDTVCNSFLGINIEVQKNPDHPFLGAFYKCFKLTAARIFSPWFYNDALFKLTSAYSEIMEHKKTMYDFILQVINKKVKNGEQTKANPNQSDDHYKMPSITELLIQTNENGGLSLIDQCEEILVLVVAGVDTSAIGISFTMHMLARHQDVQEKVYQELKEVFGDSSKEVTEEDLPKLLYLECVIKETMRLYPPVPLIARTIKEDVTLSTGQILPKDSTALVSISGIHRNPLYWGRDVHQFRPERFLEPFKHPKQYIPFSDGPRNCVGYKYALLSMKTALSVMLRHYRVLPPPSSINNNINSSNSPNTKDGRIRTGAGIVLKDKDNVLLRLQLR